MHGMDYAEAHQTFFQTRDVKADDVGTAAWRSPARRLRDAIEPIAMVFVWSEPAYEAYTACGLDFLSGYAWARASVLGEPEPGVVVAAFGVFEPGLLTALYEQARGACSREDIQAARQAGVTAALRAALGSPAQAPHVAGLLRDAAQAVALTSRPLFAGVRGLPWPQDELAQLWQAAMMLRELRGDSHLAACTAAGLTGLEANILTEMQVGWPHRAYTATRGWSPEAMDQAEASLARRGLIADGALTAAGASLRADVEERTDLQLAPMMNAIGPYIETLIPLLDGWSAQVIEHGWFPADPYKRASG
jgi:hypothetical protein